jgi:hypothetical protein
VNVHVNNGKVDTTVKRIGAENIMKNVFGFVEGLLPEWGLLAVAGFCLLTLGLSMWRNHGSGSHLLDE